MRVVSLLPSATEIVCAAGGEPLLVGRSHECDWPPGVRDRPILTAARTKFESSQQMHDAVRGRARARARRGGRAGGARRIARPSAQAAAHESGQGAGGGRRRRRRLSRRAARGGRGGGGVERASSWGRFAGGHCGPAAGRVLCWRRPRVRLAARWSAAG